MVGSEDLNRGRAPGSAGENKERAIESKDVAGKDPAGSEDVKAVADGKPEALRGEAAPVRSEQSLGKTMAAAREQRGLSQNDASREARIPAYYVRMIESDDYGLVSDQLYLLPFLRKYAIFLGLDPEEVAGRFVREVQRADTCAARMSEPIPMAEKKPSPWRQIVSTVIVVAALGAIGLFSYAYFRRSDHQRPPEASPAASPVSSPAAAAPANMPAAPSAPPIAVPPVH